MQAALFLPASDQEPFLPDALEAANEYAQKVQGFVSGQDVTKVRYGKVDVGHKRIPIVPAQNLLLWNVTSSYPNRAADTCSRT